MIVILVLGCAESNVRRRLRHPRGAGPVKIHRIIRTDQGICANADFFLHQLHHQRYHWIVPVVVTDWELVPAATAGPTLVSALGSGLVAPFLISAQLIRLRRVPDAC